MAPVLIWNINTINSPIDLQGQKNARARQRREKKVMRGKGSCLLSMRELSHPVSQLRKQELREVWYHFRSNIAGMWQSHLVACGTHALPLLSRTAPQTENGGEWVTKQGNTQLGPAEGPLTAPVPESEKISKVKERAFEWFWLLLIVTI